MKIVIDIPEDDYYAIRNGESLYAIGHDYYDKVVTNAFKLAVVLPKDHGRLVDENHIIAELVYRKNLLAGNVKCGEVTEIFNSAVVIDADKESNNGTDN